MDTYRESTVDGGLTVMWATPFTIVKGLNGVRSLAPYSS